MTPSIVATAKYTPVSSITSRTLAIPAGMANGDAVVVLVAYPGPSTTITGVTGLTGLTQDYTAYPAYIFSKLNCLATDSGTTLTITSSVAVHVSVMILIVRAAPASGSLWAGVNDTQLAFGSSGVTSPVVAPSVTGGLEVAFVAGASSAASVAAWTPAAGITIVDAIYDPATGTGNSSMAVGTTAGATTIGTNVGGDLWTDGGLGTAASAWAMVIAPLVSASSVRPTSVVSNPGGWVNVGGSPSLQASAADELDSTYAETPASPAPAAITYAHPALNTGLVTISTRDSCSAASPPITRTVTLMEGAVARASFNFVLSTTITAHTYTTTSGESAAITDRSALRVLISDTV